MKKEDGDKSAPSREATIWYIFLAMAAVLLIQSWWSNFSQHERIPFSRFEQLVEEGKVAEVFVGPDAIEGHYKETLPNGRTGFIAIRVDPQIADKLASKGVTVTGVASGGLVQSLMSWVLPALLFYGLWSMVARKMAGGQGFGGLMSIGKSRAKVYGEKDTKVTFADVAGVDEAKAELMEVVSFLRDPGRYGRLGARSPKGVLLVGPPGTGKTLLARAVAGEAGVPFFSISGSEFVEMFVGVGAARVRDLFEQARRSAPSIIFIDELDALGRTRSGAALGGYDEKEQTLNQLLSEIDGFDASVGVILLAATNRPEILDAALLRAGRFDRQVLVDRPDHGGRRAILAVHMKKIRIGPDVDLDTVAALTIGFSGADLANLVNEAAIAATRRDADAVTLDDFTSAVERLVAGMEKKSRVLSKSERRRVAYHEMGHALIAASLPGVDPVQKVSIVPRGVGALGYTMQRPTEDRFLLSESDLKNRIAVLMGGRAAEHLLFANDVSTGASDDLQRATEIALEMVTRYGMSKSIGPRTYAPAPQAFLTSEKDRLAGAAEATAREIDVAVREIIETEQSRAIEILTARRGDLEAGAELLLQKESITVADFPPLVQADRALALVNP